MFEYNAIQYTIQSRCSIDEVNISLVVSNEKQFIIVWSGVFVIVNCKCIFYEANGFFFPDDSCKAAKFIESAEDDHLHAV